MKKGKVLEVLGKLKSDMEQYNVGICNETLQDDVIALDYAINKVKKDKSYTESYWQGAWHMFLLILIIKIMDVLMTIFWG